MRIENDVKLDFKDVLIRPKRSTLNSRKDVALERTFKFKNGMVFSGIPIIAANMDTVGTMEMAYIFYKYKMPLALHKFYDVENLVTFFQDVRSRYTFYTLGTSEAELEKFREVYSRLKNSGPFEKIYGEMVGKQFHLYHVCIDVANGYSEHFNTFVKKFKAEFPQLTLMAGNVVTGEMTEELIMSGAEIIKIGIGPGSVCTTRKKTGVGYPQLSAIIECADAAHGLGAMICGDGGITNSGDVAKAFGAGADFIMCGGLFAGHDESGGEIEGVTKTLKKNVVMSMATVDPNTYKSVIVFKCMSDKGMLRYKTTLSENINSIAEAKTLTINDFYDELPPEFFDIKIDENAKMKFYGMSSDEAMNKYYNGKANYRASEGKVVYVDYSGPVENTIIDILGGLRSACTYTGAKTLKDLSKCTTFIRVTQQLNEVFGKS